jgi:hypothetical protein
MSTLTKCTLPVVNYPIKFLGATLLSLNSQAGWGLDNSTLDVELVEDCVVPQFAYNTFTETVEEYTVPDSFLGKTQEIIGGAAYFSLPAPDPNYPFDKFKFGGIITGWTVRQSTSGKVYSVKLSDPKILLDNTLIIVDNYSDFPYQHNNYYNAFAAYELSVNYGNTAVFGNAGSSERGMYYNNIVRALLALGFVAGDPYGRPLLFSNTAPNLTIFGTGRFKLDLGLLLNPFPLDGTLNDYTWHTSSIYVNPNRLVNAYGNPVESDSIPLAPDFYKITGSLSVTELINNICELTGRKFYTSLVYDPILLENIIRVSTVQLNPFTSYTNILDTFNGVATDISYGKELRNDKTRKMIVGDNIHYLSTTSDFIPFFGENKLGLPIIPLIDNEGSFINPFTSGSTSCGFWVEIDAQTLNASLYNPILDPSIVSPDPENPVPIDSFWVSEADIRAALAGSQMFNTRLLNKDLNPAWASGTWTSPEKYEKSLINSIHQTPAYAQYTKNITTSITELLNTWAPSGVYPNKPLPLNDMLFNAGLTNIGQYTTVIADDLDKIHKFIQDLGQTYYGRQFLATLNEPIAVKLSDTNLGEYGFGEKIYSSSPTNDGGWVDYGVPVLGLTDPALAMFRTDDDRIGCFARFNNMDYYDTGVGSGLNPSGLMPDETWIPPTG